MLHLRRHSLFPWVCLLYMAALAVPSVHHLSHWAQPVSDAWHVAVTDAAGHDKISDGHFHTETECPTCEVTGTLLAPHLDAVAEVRATHSDTLPSLGEDVYIATHTTALSARAPPARS